MISLFLSILYSDSVLPPVPIAYNLLPIAYCLLPIVIAYRYCLSPIRLPFDVPRCLGPIENPSPFLPRITGPTDPRPRA